MTKKDAAINNFKNGFNCAQSVLMAYKDETNIIENDLLKISCGFGGGMGRLQNICGAASGAFMVIGLKYGKYKIDDNDAREKTYALVREFDSEFKNKFKTDNCLELLGCNLMTEEGNKYFHDNNLRDKVCVKCIEESINILDKLLK